MIIAPVLAAAGAALLYEQAIVTLLHQRFHDENTTYILLDAPHGRVVDMRWPAADERVAVGSLVKPFTALAYGEAHGFRFPEYTCRGTVSRCWYPIGHGRIGIVAAIAHSCNSYFDGLAEEIGPEEADPVIARFSLAEPAAATAAAYVGRAGLWRIAPMALAKAFVQLLADPAASVPRAGMAECARSGTARMLTQGLAKTGTAPCSHHPHAPGDGFVIATDRVEAPRYLLLVRVHGVPGAQAALRAAGMMRVIREGK